MIILNEKDILEIGIDWKKNISVIEESVKCLMVDDYAQPIKPYLRYRNKKNRIIAMPAFVGGNINKAGIKWIASFPDNIKKGMVRAHSVLILNDADTGEPLAVICTPLLSVIRTASVSAMVIDHFDRLRMLKNINIGIIGFGPIGNYHLKMCMKLLGDRIENIFLHDLRTIDPSQFEGLEVIRITKTWEEAYVNSDIVITCTVSDSTYIDRQPKPGSLHLNVSLRDYKTSVYEWFKDSIIVDNWDEICRERTDIEMMHLERGLQKDHTKSIIDIVENNCLQYYNEVTPVMFNPMGMAVFDIAIADFYYQAVRQLHLCEVSS